MNADTAIQAVTLMLCLAFNFDCAYRLGAILAIYAAQVMHASMVAAGIFAGGGYYIAALATDGGALALLSLFPASWFRTKLAIVLVFGFILNAYGVWGYEAGIAISEPYKKLAALLLIAQTIAIATGGSDGDARMPPRDFIHRVGGWFDSIRSRAHKAMGGGQK